MKCFNSWAVLWFCVTCYLIMECTERLCKLFNGDVKNWRKKAPIHLDIWIIYCSRPVTNWYVLPVLTVHNEVTVSFCLSNCLYVYLQNTSDDLNLALEIWNNCRKEHQLTQSINFLSVLAINQEQPQMALEILPPNDKHFSSVNVRLLALSKCGHFAEANEIVQNILSHNRNVRISLEVVS